MWLKKFFTRNQSQTHVQKKRDISAFETWIMNKAPKKDTQVQVPQKSV